MLKGLLMSVGYCLLRLIYGKEEFEKRKFKMIDGVWLSMAFALWILTLLGTFTDSQERIFCIIYAILFPTAIVVWTVIARRKLSNANPPFNHLSTDEVRPPNEIRFCQNCGFEFPEGDLPNFCSKCGSKVQSRNQKENDDSKDTALSVILLVGILVGFSLIGIIVAILG